MPVATPPNAIVFSSGWIDIRQMAQVGIGLNVLGILLVTAMSYAALYFILGIDPEVFPAWAASPASGHRTPVALLTDDQVVPSTAEGVNVGDSLQARTQSASRVLHVDSRSERRERVDAERYVSRKSAGDYCNSLFESLFFVLEIAS